VAQARFFVDGKVHGAAPAPYRAIELVAAARERSRDEGFAAEDEAMADLFVSDEFKASLYAFDLTQKRARHAAGAPDAALARPVTKVGVVGAGLMAAQIALLFARRLSVPVVLTDLDQARLDSGVGYVHGEIAKLAARGRLGADAAARLTGLVSGSLSLTDAFADADFVIEAVFEEMSVKKKVFADVEAVVRPDCVLATNTSSLSVTEMASALSVPSRVAGFHFFNPVAMMPLVEVVRGDLTDDAAVATALAVGKGLKKNCVLVRDAPAFVVNRLLTRFLGAITAAVDEGTPFDVAEHAADPLGLPMPPFLLLQLVGPAVALHVAETLHAAFPSRYGVSPKLRALVESGATAVYAPDFSVDPAVAALLAGGSHPSTGEQVLQRARGHRLVHDPRRRLAVPPRRHHPVPGPHRRRRKGNRRQIPVTFPGYRSCLHPGDGQELQDLDGRARHLQMRVPVQHGRDRVRGFGLQHREAGDLSRLPGLRADADVAGGGQRRAQVDDGVAGLARPGHPGVHAGLRLLGRGAEHLLHRGHGCAVHDQELCHFVLPPKGPNVSMSRVGVNVSLHRSYRIGRA
jgi:3-hydroxyacyl-CoA dehydrogenase